MPVSVFHPSVDAAVLMAADTPLFNFSVVFAIAASAAGVGLGAIAWQIFRGSPFGKTMGGLVAILALLAFYHGVLLVVDRHAVPILESVAFTGLLVWVVYTIHIHRRLAPREGRR